MPKRTRKLLCIAGCIVLFVTVVVLHQSRMDSAESSEGPVARWVFDRAKVAASKVPDTVGSLHAALTGEPTFSTDPPALQFRGEADGAVVQAKVDPNAAFLPREAITLTAWVRIDHGARLGGVVGLQDQERGFLLGHDASRFTFGLSAQQGDGRMAWVTSKSPLARGKWHYLAATYDGKTMRLFVNGQPEGDGTSQSGPIAYPTGGALVLGRYRDGLEDASLLGAIREVAIYRRALSRDEIGAQFKANKDLAELPAAEGPHFVVAPYLQFPTRESMTIMWETSVKGTSVVEYDTKTPPAQKVELKKDATLHEVVLTKLQPNTKYFYRVSTTDAGGTTLRSGLRPFMTAVDEDSAFSFTVIGDTQKNPRTTAQIARLMWERRPNFVVHVGDVVDNGPDKREWEDELFRPCFELFGRVPVLPTIGNHEKNHAWYYRYFSLPDPEYYYRYHYGNADFFVVDSNKSLKPDSEQYAWLDRELGKSTAKWKFVYHHHPVYTSDDDDYGNSWTGTSKLGDTNARNLVALYEKHNVDVVFNGHIHVYERTWPVRDGKVDREKGVVYVTSGGGGGRLENFAPTPSWFKSQVRVDYHFCLVNIHRGRLEFKAFDQGGRLFDFFDLRKD